MFNPIACAVLVVLSTATAATASVGPEGDGPPTGSGEFVDQGQVVTSGRALSLCGDAPTTPAFPPSLHLLGAGPDSAPRLTERGGVGWDVAGIFAGIATGAAAGVALSSPFKSSNYADVGKNSSQDLIAATLGAAGLGVAGYFLGEAARNGSGAARVALVTLNIVIGLAVTGATVGTIALLSNGSWFGGLRY